jgi:hypothetical protein
MAAVFTFPVVSLIHLGRHNPHRIRMASNTSVNAKSGAPAQRNLLFYYNAFSNTPNWYEEIQQMTHCNV